MTKQYVFVLGAGASVELGLPMGSGLTKEIRAALNFQTDGWDITAGDEAVRGALQHIQVELPRWYECSTLIASAMPLAPSIDNFVDVHRTDSDLAYCAKIAICKCILDAERASKIYVDPSNIYNSIDFSKTASWHTLFFRSLTQYCTAEDLPGRLKSIAIVTFNYDRCLEHFLLYAIATYYNIPRDRAAEILSNLTVLHPYGQVGELPFLTATPPTSYGEAPKSSDLRRLANDIRTFTESVDSGEVERIRQTVFDCKKLVFLGFAYHPLNVDLLFAKPASGTPTDYSKQIFGTALGSSPSDTALIADDLFQRFRCDRNAVTLRNDLTCTALFMEYSRTLALA